jgi:predicted membrane protein
MTDLYGPQPAPPGFRVTPQLIFGLLVICVGVLFTLDNLGIANAVSYLQYWPLGIVAIGLVKLSQSKEGGGQLAGLIFLVVGLWLLLENLDVIRISLRQLWPMVLVLIGGWLVWHGMTRREPTPAAAAPSSASNDAASVSTPTRPRTGSGDGNSHISAMAIMGGVAKGNNSRAFRGGDLLAIMGSCEIDLRKAAINGEAVIDVFTIWGGIEIRVPEDWTVVSHIVPLMGGVEDTTRPPQGATAHYLTLRGLAIMGGVEIKN